jgi:transposase
MWTAKNRVRYDRSKLRYPSDLTDDEWAHVAPLIAPAKRGGNRRHVDVREVMNGIMYVFEHGMPVAGDPERPATAQHAVRLSRLVELGRHAGSHPSRALCGVPRARRTGSQPNRRHHRQPKREER